jgi:hypothetical protein
MFTYKVVSNGSSVFISSGGGGEKSDFGSESVKSIDVLGGVSLNGTTVNGNVNARGSIKATNATVSNNIKAGGNATLSNTKCTGKVWVGGSINTTDSTVDILVAGGNITVTNSKVTSAVTAGGNVTANGCEQLGKVTAGGSVTFQKCGAINTISAGGSVNLHSSKVLGNVSPGGRAIVVESKIKGVLTCSIEGLVVEKSIIGTIRIRSPHAGLGNNRGVTLINMSGGGSRVSINGMSVVSGNNGSYAVTGNQSVGDLGGGSVIINGVPLSDLMKGGQAAPAKAQPRPKQILELRNSTVKNVIFEGGNGEVVLSGESELTGTVTGGSVLHSSSEI